MSSTEISKAPGIYAVTTLVGMQSLHHTVCWLPPMEDSTAPAVHSIYSTVLAERKCFQGNFKRSQHWYDFIGFDWAIHHFQNSSDWWIRVYCIQSSLHRMRRYMGVVLKWSTWALFVKEEKNAKQLQRSLWRGLSWESYISQLFFVEA